MKYLLIACLISLIGSCTSQSDHSDPPSSPNPTPTLQTHRNTEKSSEFKIPNQNNSALFGGCSFGNALQAWYRVGDWQTLLAFTSIGIRKKYGDKKLLDHFKTMDLAFEIHLKSQNVISTDTTALNYETIKFGTKEKLTILTVIENDSVKWVLTDLKNFN